MLPPPTPRLGPDGVARSVEAEKRLNVLFHEMLTSPAGAECLKYLRRITIETVSGPHISGDELRHREGQRFLVGLMQSRMAQHVQDQSETINAPQPAHKARSRVRRTGS